MKDLLLVFLCQNRQSGVLGLLVTSFCGDSSFLLAEKLKAKAIWCHCLAVRSVAYDILRICFPRKLAPFPGTLHSSRSSGQNGASHIDRDSRKRAVHVVSTYIYASVGRVRRQPLSKGMRNPGASSISLLYHTHLASSLLPPLSPVTRIPPPSLPLLYKRTTPVSLPL